MQILVTIYLRLELINGVFWVQNDGGFTKVSRVSRILKIVHSACLVICEIRVLRLIISFCSGSNEKLKKHE